MSNRLLRHFGRMVIQSRAMSRKRKGPVELSEFVVPVPLKPANNSDDISVVTDLTEKISMREINKFLNLFASQEKVTSLARENGLDAKLFAQVFNSFRNYCKSPAISPELHIILGDLKSGSGHVTDIFPYFLQHAKEKFPHLDCMEELTKISDLRIPANYYPEARAMKRKIIFHSGPTNSGKTYNALKAFTNSKKGVYCGPLKMLAVEVFNKTNALGVPCDLLTGEDRQQVQGAEISDHLSCTVEMTSITDPVDVAVIDEIQMLKDFQRGWAWTRALLGIPASEIHLCGEEAAIPLIEKILLSTGETLEIQRYERLTELRLDEGPLLTLDNLQPGDCVVCFSKADIYKVSLACEKLEKECAVIYGGLPPNTKAAQAKKFNDPDDPCKILIATDAIGMGLNLSIRRIVFYGISKLTLDNGQLEKMTLSVSQLLQIAGRAGRYNTTWDVGYVTALFAEDFKLVEQLFKKKPPPIEKAGLHPSADQIELFAFYLPNTNMSTLVDIFISMSQLDDFNYFYSDLEVFKQIADRIQHISMPLRARYVFCCAPINMRNSLITTLLVKFAHCYARNVPITVDRMKSEFKTTLKPPETIVEMVHLEEVFDTCDLYLWMSLRFRDLFPHQEEVKNLRKEIDDLIEEGVSNITKLLKIGGRKKLRFSRDLKTKGEDDGGGDVVSKDKDVKSRLTNRLLAEGLITKEQLLEMRQEWLEDGSMSGSGKTPKNE